MKIASLDLGSNTFLLLVADVTNQKVEKVYQDQLRVTRMAEGVHATGLLQPQALLRAEECFSEYAEIIAGERPDKVVAMATSAARDAKNGAELFKLGEKYGIPIQIIPGSKEAQISFSGSTFEFSKTVGIATIDVGGGSTEFVVGLKDKQIFGQSLNVGSVRLTELLISSHPISKSEIKKIEDYVFEAWPKALNKFIKSIRQVVAVAGTPTTLAAVMQRTPYSSEKVHGFEISCKDLRGWRDRLADMSVEERRALPGMDSKRADVIVAGATILLCLAEKAEVSNITVSDKGVRYGIALMAERGEC